MVAPMHSCHVNERRRYTNGGPNKHLDAKRRRWSSSRWAPLPEVDIPPENYLGVVLGDRYQITFQWSKKEHVGVYSVRSFFTGEAFMARVFQLTQLPDKLYLSSKRRVKRLKNSENLEADFKMGGSRYLISRYSSPEVHGREPHSSSQQCSDRKTADHIAKTCPDWPNLNHGSAPGPPGSPTSSILAARTTGFRTYAQTAALAAPVIAQTHMSDCDDTINGFPVSRKGSRQRERRQRRREDRRRKAAHANGGAVHNIQSGPAGSAPSEASSEHSYVG